MTHTPALDIHLEQIPEWHTTDLLARCLRKLYLQHKGKAKREYPKAMYRGQVAGYACALVHTHATWEFNAVPGFVDQAMHQVDKEAAEEGRPLTESVQAGRDEIHAEVQKHVVHYIKRLSPFFSQCEFIGCEVPCRLMMRGGPEKGFASHLDLLFRDRDGMLNVWDWKWWTKFMDGSGNESPTMAYLGRNLQFGLYHLCVSDTQGYVLLPADVAAAEQTNDPAQWTSYQEECRLGWVDLSAFKPYARKTTVKNRDGTETTYLKGDDRPLDQIVKRWTIADEKVEDLKADMLERVRMANVQMFPKTPDPLGCHLCECEPWCEPYHDERRAQA